MSTYATTEDVLSTSKYKINDVVRCVGESSGEEDDLTYGGAGWTETYEFVVGNVTKRSLTNRFIYWPKDGGGGVYENHLDLVHKANGTVPEAPKKSIKSKGVRMQELAGTLREGQYVYLYEPTTGSLVISGEIGEIDKEKGYVYLWQNDYSGTIGKKSPTTKGYKFSWVTYLTAEYRVRFVSKKAYERITFKKTCPLERGDIVKCLPNAPHNSFTGEAKVAYVGTTYLYLVLATGAGGDGFRLLNGRFTWIFRIAERSFLTLVRRGDKTIDIQEDPKKAKFFAIGDTVRTNAGKEGKIIGDDRGDYSLYYKIKYSKIKYSGTSGAIRWPDESTGEEFVKSVDLTKIKVRVKKEPVVPFEPIGTPEETKLVKPGCLVEIRHCKEAQAEGYPLGYKGILSNRGRYGQSEYCYLSKGFLTEGDRKWRGYYSVRPPYLRVIKDLSVGKEVTVAKNVLASFYDYAGEKSPIVLLGANKSGVIDVFQLATDGRGCDALATMTATNFSVALRNLLLMKRKWVGFGVVYKNGRNTADFSGEALNFIMKFLRPNDVYLCINSRRSAESKEVQAIYPYRITKYNKDYHLLNVPVKFV